MSALLLTLVMFSSSAAELPQVNALKARTEQAEASFLDEPADDRNAQGKRQPLAVGMAMGCAALMMALGVGVAYSRLKSNTSLKANGSHINLLAYKPLGGRQRLALVEVCGERLLLAANEREVTLLSHLPAADDLQSAAAIMRPVAEEAQDKMAEPEAVEPARGQTVAALQQALDHAQSARMENNKIALSSDLAGLQRWQQQAHAQRHA